jgi:stage V sporulation protein AB
VLLKYAVLIIAGASFGCVASAGVFTVLAALGLVPRFAGKTHTAAHILCYENCVIFGTITGALFSIFESLYPVSRRLFQSWDYAAGCIAGFLIGCFVGSLALSIAEMLDAIPIFARRVRLRWGIGIAVFIVALGKMSGALLYFLAGIE